MLQSNTKHVLIPTTDVQTGRIAIQAIEQKNHSMIGILGAATNGFLRESKQLDQNLDDLNPEMFHEQLKRFRMLKAGAGKKISLTWMLSISLISHPS